MFSAFYVWSKTMATNNSDLAVGRVGSEAVRHGRAPGLSPC